MPSSVWLQSRPGVGSVLRGSLGTGAAVRRDPFHEGTKAGLVSWAVASSLCLCLDRTPPSLNVDPPISAHRRTRMGSAGALNSHFGCRLLTTLRASFQSRAGVGTIRSKRGHPACQLIYRRLEAAMAELRQQPGGRPAPAEAEGSWTSIWHLETRRSASLEGQSLKLTQAETSLAEVRAVVNNELGRIDEGVGGPPRNPAPSPSAALEPWAFPVAQARVGLAKVDCRQSTMAGTVSPGWDQPTTVGF